MFEYFVMEQKKDEYLVSSIIEGCFLTRGYVKTNSSRCKSPMVMVVILYLLAYLTMIRKSAE